MHKRQPGRRPVIAFLKDETNLVGVIVSSICTVPIALLLDTQEAALIVVFISTAASCVCFAATFIQAVWHKGVRRSLRNPVLAAGWLIANSITFYLVAGSQLLSITLVIGSILSILTIGYSFLFSHRS